MQESIHLKLEQNGAKDFNSKKGRDKMILDYSAKIKSIHLNYFEDQILFEDKDFPALNNLLFVNQEEQDKA